MDEGCFRFDQESYLYKNISELEKIRNKEFSFIHHLGKDVAFTKFTKEIKHGTLTPVCSKN